MNSVSNLSTGNGKILCIGLDKQRIDYSSREFLSLKVKLNQISNTISRPLATRYPVTICIVVF